MRALCFLLAAASLAFAQLDDNTITVTASRSVNLQPDQVLVLVSVQAAPLASLDDVLALLQGTGVTAANLNSASSPTLQVPSGPLAPGGQFTNWSFTLAVSFDKLKDLFAALSRAQQALPNSAASSLTYYLETLQVSQDLQNSQPCPFPALVSDARRQAQSVAALAGMGVGPIVAMAQGTGGIPAWVNSPFFRAGDFSASAITGVLSLSSFLVSAPQPSATCSLTVQFKLQR
jgi:hypothetical protein